MSAAGDAADLAAELGCEVTPHPLRSGIFEALKPAPGVHLLVGTPGEIRAEVRRIAAARHPSRKPRRDRPRRDAGTDS